ncbi:hypothetical protein [Flaviaesturariibacter terrae]
MKNILLFFLVYSALPAAAQRLLEPFGTGYQRLTALAPSFSSAASQEYNPASIAAFSSPSMNVSGERRFGLSALSVYRLQAAAPLASGVAGLSATIGGNPGWQELAFRGSYARQLGARASVGIGAEWQRLGNAVYGHAATLQATAGFRWELTHGVFAGLRVQNPARARLGKDPGERLPASYGLGVGWQSDSTWLLAVELAHRDGAPPAIAAGVEYVFAPALRARCGIDTGAPAAWIGLGTALAHMRLDVTVTLHRELGPTPALVLQFPAQ